jgi:putative endonuclease
LSNCAKNLPPWFLYLIQTSSGTLYTGVTTDVDRRFNEHSQSGKKAARFLRGKGPLNLRFSAEVGERSAALRMEAAVKKLSRDAKLQLIDSGQLPTLD